MKRGFFRRKQRKENNEILKELTQAPAKEVVIDDEYFDPDFDDLDEDESVEEAVSEDSENIDAQDTSENDNEEHEVASKSATFVEASAEDFEEYAENEVEEDTDTDVSQTEIAEEDEILSEGYFVEDAEDTEDESMSAFEAALEDYFCAGDDEPSEEEDNEIVENLMNNTPEAEETNEDIDKEKDVYEAVIEKEQSDSDSVAVEVEKESNMDKIIEQNVLMAVEHDQTSIAKLSESTGRIEKMLGKHGEDYTKELSKAFENLISKDPSAAATIFMAATVATLQTYDGDTDKMAEELDIDDRDITMAEYEFNARYKAN